MKILHLTLKKEYFDAIALGKKTIEYREIKPFWTNRFIEEKENKDNIIKFDEVWFRNGYRAENPIMRVEWKNLFVGPYNNKYHYCIELGKVLEIKNWEGPKK